MNKYSEGWHEEMSTEETKKLAYWERNMLALLVATLNNDLDNRTGCKQPPFGSGWYHHGEWDGWARVISIDEGRITFHVPDDFDLGDLPQIEPNWDGHTTKEKWKRVMAFCGVKDE